MRNTPVRKAKGPPRKDIQEPVVSWDFGEMCAAAAALLACRPSLHLGLGRALIAGQTALKTCQHTFYFIA